MSHESELSTRQRLIESAGELFGEKGFHATSIREICAKADANVAAVNYHFQDKDKLREEVLVHVLQYGSDAHPIEDVINPGRSPEEQLLAFVRRFLLTRIDPSRPSWHEMVMYREMTDPGPNMKAVVERGIRRNAEALFGILCRLFGEDAPRTFVERCQHCVIGQCIHFVHHRRVVDRVHPGLIDTTPEGIEILARHITEFSLAAVRNIPVPQPGSDPSEGGA